MIVSLAANEIDVAIGLTEGWVAGLAKHLASYTNSSEKAPYKIVGTYVETPLCWAISTGANRPDITSVDVLCGKKMGVSRIGRYATNSPLNAPDHQTSFPCSDSVPT